MFLPPLSLLYDVLGKPNIILAEVEFQPGRDHNRGLFYIEASARLLFGTDDQGLVRTQAKYPFLSLGALFPFGIPNN